MDIGVSAAEGVRVFDIADHQGIRLDIGCGANKQEGFVGLDAQALPGVDIVWDVNLHPWPLPDECVLMATCSHLAEHIPTVMVDRKEGTWFPFIEFMDEVWRIMKPGGQFLLSMPHGRSSGFLQDPTHTNAMNQHRFAYFDPTIYMPDGERRLYDFYRPRPWKNKYISWDPSGNMEVVLQKMVEVSNE